MEINEKRKYWFFGSKLNTALLAILIILMIIALRWMYENKAMYFPSQHAPYDSMSEKDAEYWDKFSVPTPPLGDMVGSDGKPLDQTQWVKLSNSNLVYNSNWQVKPIMYRNAAQEANGEAPQISGYTFILSDGSIIEHGGGPQSGCSIDEFGKFQYGISTTACVQGVRSEVEPKSTSGVSSKPSQSDLNAFGDFVLKNND